MLKWTVMPRPKAAEDQRPLPATPRSADRRQHRRRSTPSARTRRSLDALEADKENQFTSTPIKGEALGGGLRDVSNLTPTAVRTQPADGKRLSSTKKSKASKKLIHTPPSSPRHRHKKKKDCITAHYYDFLSADSLASNYFRPLETVDSHIEGILDDIGCSCKPKKVADTYAPTLPTFTSEYSPCATRTTHCLETLNRNSSKKVPVISKILDDVPSNTKPRIDHVEDFLHQISFITSPETPFKQNRNKVTPLVKRILDFKFSKCAEEQNDSSYINNMSLDKIVDAILDSSDDSIRPTVRRALNTSLIVNVESENENFSKEENLIHAMEVKKVAMDGSENSSDSGFRSSATDNPHSLDNNFHCKCNNNHKESVTEKTIIQLDETYNERYVDDSSRKRPAVGTTDATSPKRLHLDQSRNELEFTLKRQRCIRRRRPHSTEKPNIERNCYLETKCLPTVVKEVSGDSDFKSSKTGSVEMPSDDFRISMPQTHNDEGHGQPQVNGSCAEKSSTGGLSVAELRAEGSERKDEIFDKATDEYPTDIKKRSADKDCTWKANHLLCSDKSGDGHIENEIDQCIEEHPNDTKSLLTPSRDSADKDWTWKENHALCTEKSSTEHSSTQPKRQTNDDKNCYPEIKSISNASNLAEESCSSYKSKNIDDSSVEKKRYMETRGLASSTFAEESFFEYRSIRKCLLSDLSNNDSSLSEISSRSGVIDVRGCVELKMYGERDAICVDVVRCTDLFRPNGEKINAYVKVCVSDRLGARKKNPGLQRTAVHSESANPYFNHTFKFPLIQDDCQRRVHIEVWHRDRTNRLSEFLGCVSFDVGNVIKEGPISGAYLLQAHRQGRSVTPPLAASASSAPAGGGMLQCGDDGGGACDDAVFLDDAGAAAFGCDEPLSRSATCDDKQTLDEQQKYADEHLFLRYLELDPTEGPDATCAATQRTAAAAAGGGATPRQGRTPFTHTKRLVRSRPSGGFGFSVVWTRPPRVERVERGGAADRAGLLPGDYIIFVDRFNVVTMPEMEVLSLIRSCGNQLTLEVFRRPGGGGGAMSSRNGSLPTANKRLSASCAPLSRPSIAAPPTRRPSTVCSTTAHTTVTEYGGVGSQRRRLHLATTPQAVAFCTEKSNNPEENRRKAMYQLISKEQQYATHLQFAISRFVSALNERKDLITSAEHRVLFQNCDEILRITEDILDNLIQEDGEPQIHLLVRTYHMKLHEITTAYRKYCSGIKKADCILANKTKNANSDFSRFLQVPQIPRRRPDITAFIHKPLEHYREMLRLLITIQGNTKSNHEDFPVINKVVHDLQLTYREITAGSGLMEPVGEGRPLLTVQDLENRLVFTKCKPFVLNKPGRQWIFGGDLTRVEGRNVRQCWALLFSDLLLFAKASRDRVLFVIEEPLPLSHVSDVVFNVRKKDTEFRLTINPEGKKASSPTVHCGPDLTRTPRKGAGRKTVLTLRAPTPELKAVWQNLLQKQIYQATCNMDGSSPNSPLESPEVPITSSVATLHSAESLSVVRRQVRQADINNDTPTPTPYPKHHTYPDRTFEGHSTRISSHSSSEVLSSNHLSAMSRARISSSSSSQASQAFTSDFMRTKHQILMDKTPDTPSANISQSSSEISQAFTSHFNSETPQPTPYPSSEAQKQLDLITEHKCKQLRRSSNCNNRYNAIHLERWMKGQLESEQPPDAPEVDSIEEEWTEEQVRKRSEELQLIDKEGNVTCKEINRGETRCEEEIILSDHSPSKSTTTESQVTVRSSPQFPETVPVCRQCHKNCLSNNGSIKNYNDCNSNKTSPKLENSGNCRKAKIDKDWQPLVHLGITTSSYVSIDPFSVPVIPKISVLPATPENSTRTASSENDKDESNPCQNVNCNQNTSCSRVPIKLEYSNELDNSPDDSPQTEEHPYHSLSSSVATLRRFGTVSSLERVGSEEREEDDVLEDGSRDQEDEDDEDEDEEEDDDDGGVDNEAFYQTSIRHWTIRAGSFVAEKMAFFEKLGEDYRTGGLFDRYLKSSDNPLNGEEQQEEETSGGTSGEEIWGTPTSGEMDDNLSPYGDRQSPNEGSLNSDFADDTELMMDELLMTPPITGAVMRGLLPRRTLEPLIEEEGSETSSSSDDSTTEPSRTNSEQGRSLTTGAVADTCSAIAAAASTADALDADTDGSSAGGSETPPGTPPNSPEAGSGTAAGGQREDLDQQEAMVRIHRAESYRRIVEAAEEDLLEEGEAFFFNRFKPAAKFVNIERVPRSKSIKIFEFFNVRKPERRIYESFPEGRQYVQFFHKDESSSNATPDVLSSKPTSPRRLRDKQLDRRFWKQLSKRRSGKVSNPA